MKTAIIVSSKDTAGVNIRQNLVEGYGFEKTEETFRNEAVYKLGDIKLYTTDIFTVYHENIDKEVDADFFLFATKHKSEKGVPSLSVHSPGNWGKADFGGKEKTLSVCPAGYLKKALKLLEKNNSINFDVVQECTHHGPDISKPCMFIEIGSTEKEWARKDAGDVIAKTIVELLGLEITESKAAFGIGGLHTTPNFKKIQLDSDVAIGHVCPKYNLINLDKEMISQALEKTTPKASLVILDWKGLGEHKERIANILNELGVEWKKTKDY